MEFFVDNEEGREEDGMSHVCEEALKTALAPEEEGLVTG